MKTHFLTILSLITLSLPLGISAQSKTRVAEKDLLQQTSLGAPCPDGMIWEYEPPNPSVYSAVFTHNSSFYTPTALTLKSSAQDHLYANDYNFSANGYIWRVGLPEYEQGDFSVKIPDIDCYIFKTYGAANITIRMTCPDNDYHYHMNEYDFELYRHHEGGYLDNPPSAENIHTFIASSSAHVQSGDVLSREIVFATETPGVFYLKVKSNVPENHCRDHPYNIIGEIRYKYKNPASVTYMREALGAKYALWLSDFDPGLRPVFSELHRAKIDTGNPFYDAGTQTFSDIKANSEKTEDQAAIYVWDTETKRILSEMFSQLWDSLDKNITELERLHRDVSLVVNITEGASFICSISSDITNAAGFPMIAASFEFSSVVLDFVTLLVDYFLVRDIKRDLYDLTELMNYYSQMALVCSLSVDAPNQTIRLPFYYGVTKTTHIFVTNEIFALYNKAIVTYDFTSYKLIGDTIPQYNDKNVFRGRIFPIRNNADLQNAFRRIEIPPIPPTPPVMNILSNSYGLPEQYNFDLRFKEYNYSDARMLSIDYLRAGYISNKYLTLSAKRNNAGTAYIYYSTPYKAITQTDWQMALWSDDESLQLNSSIRLESWYNGQWNVEIDFDYHSLSKSKDSLLDYSHSFSVPVTGFRIIVRTNAVKNENNRGRLVIGNVGIHNKA